MVGDSWVGDGAMRPGTRRRYPLPMRRGPEVQQILLEQAIVEQVRIVKRKESMAGNNVGNGW